MSRMIYTTGPIPSKYFQFLPRRVREAMLANLVDVVNHTGSATMIGDDSYKIIVPWCIANCSKRFCFDGEAQVVMFESAEDCTLFMTARPQTPS